MRHLMKSNLLRCLCAFTASSLLCCQLHAQEPPFTEAAREQARGETIVEIGQVREQQGAAGLLQYLQTINLGTLDQAEPNETADAISGVSLSKPFVGDSSRLSVDSLFGGRIVRSIDEYKTSIKLAVLLDGLQDTKLSEVMDWFAARATRAPATRADRIMVFLMSGDFSGLPASYWQTKKAQWDGFLSAKNPAHRLIAIQNVRLFESNRTQLLANYQSGLHEKNTALQNAAFEGLKLMTGTEPRTMLQGFLNEQHAANDGTMPEGFDINAAIQEYLNPPAP